jgi:hypothetical protein
VKRQKAQKEGAETLGNASARGKVEKNEKQNTKHTTKERNKTRLPQGIIKRQPKKERDEKK